MEKHLKNPSKNPSNPNSDKAQNPSNQTSNEAQKPRRRRKSAAVRLKSIAMALAPHKTPQVPHMGKGSFGSESGGSAYGFISMIGRSGDMEDKVTVAPVAGEYSFFAVYDGHGGAEVADRCGEKLHMLLEKNIQAKKAKETNGCLDWEKVMFECFCSMDDEIKGGEDGPGERKMGSTAVLVVVGKEDLVVAHCGDSRAVLYRSDEVVVPLSEDHKPDREDERERIEAAGGKVIRWNGWRVEGILATSRSLGDHYLKPYVTSEPELNVMKRSELDEFVIIGSDGLFDVMSNERACKVVKDSLKKTTKHSRERGASEAAAMLVERALRDGSKDNISVIVVKMA